VNNFYEKELFSTENFFDPNIFGVGKIKGPGGPPRQRGAAGLLEGDLCPKLDGDNGGGDCSLLRTFRVRKLTPKTFSHTTVPGQC
jgi:hypothetical protein